MSLKAKHHVMVQYTMREGNNLADFFANQVFCFAGTQVIKYSNFAEVPTKGKTIINLEKLRSA